VNPNDGSSTASPMSTNKADAPDMAANLFIVRYVGRKDFTVFFMTTFFFKNLAEFGKPDRNGGSEMSVIVVLYEEKIVNQNVN
jgi:hypothetical protein